MNENINNNITFDKAKKIADEKARECNKVVVGISENDEYWRFDADNDSHPIDDGAGSCFISKKDGSIRELNRWDVEFTKKFDETAKKYLVRTSLSEFYGYHSKNHITDKKQALEFVNSIISELSNYSFNSDDNFVLLGRKKVIYDEINDVLRGTKKVDNPIYFVLGSLEEFICNNNFIYMSDAEKWEKGWEDLRNRNYIYSIKNIICLEEKNVIEKIINKIIDNINNQPLQENIANNLNKKYTYSRKEFEEMFEKDENGAFIRLIIPANPKVEEDKEELNLIGKLPKDFSLDEVVRMKTYARYIADHIIYPNDINNTINVIVDVIEYLPEKTEISISQILGSNIKNYDNKELFEITKRVIDKCKEEGIHLNFDKYKDKEVGLPFNIPFVKDNSYFI